MMTTVVLNMHFIVAVCFSLFITLLSQAVNKTEVQNCLLETENATVKVNRDHSSFERTNTRVSLTCRLVPKVHKHLFRH